MQLADLLRDYSNCARTIGSSLMAVKAELTLFNLLT